MEMRDIPAANATSRVLLTLLVSVTANVLMEVGIYILPGYNNNSAYV